MKCRSLWSLLDWLGERLELLLGSWLLNRHLLMALHCHLLLHGLNHRLSWLFLQSRWHLVNLLRSCWHLLVLLLLLLLLPDLLLLHLHLLLLHEHLLLLLLLLQQLLLLELLLLYRYSWRWKWRGCIIFFIVVLSILIRLVWLSRLGRLCWRLLYGSWIDH